MKEKSMAEIIVTVWFVLIGTLMYYFLTQVIQVGLFITYRHAFALVLVFSAVVCFLIKPDAARGIVCLKGAFIYSVPLIVTLAVSLFIWFAGQVDTAVVFRGLSSSLVYMNMLSFALAAGAFLYIFGEKGIWYNLLSILIANILMIITIIAQNGIGPFFSELVTLVITFAGETGDIIIQAEIHELAFCIGAYLVYMLFKPKKDIYFIVLFILSMFCFVAAFKRIGIISVALVLVIGWVLKLVAKIKEDIARRWVYGLSIAVVVILIAYIVIIKMGAFAYLEKSGVDTNGRMVIYEAVDKYYEFSPEFFGNGIGFLTYQLNTNMTVGVASVHNDFLQYYIDLGFWGYIIWLVSMTLVRVKCFGGGKGADGEILTFILMVYLIISSSTDNTMNYPLLMGVLALLMMGNGFDRRVEETEMKIFGCISADNGFVK